MTTYPFTYDNLPATLDFAEETGPCSVITYIDRGVKTTLEIQSFAFNEKELRLTVHGKQTGLFTDGSFTYGPNDFTVDATTQESLDYFEQFTYTYPLIKRQEVNGVSASFLHMILFNPETGAFDPQNIPVGTPTEPAE